MKILMLSYEFPPLGGGGARVVYGLARELVGLGHQVDLVTMGFRSLPDLEEVDGIRVHRVRCLRRREEICHPHEMLTYVGAAVPKVLHLLDNHRYDINNTHFIFPDGLVSHLVRRRKALPFVITTHGSDVPGYNPDRFKLHHKLLAPVWRRVTGSAAELICPSESLREMVLRSEAELPTRVIPNGVRISRFDPARPKENRILVVTRMFQRKGVQHLLSALDDLTLDHEVHIVGDGPYLAELNERARSARTPVVFHGWLDNADPLLRELYETARIFVLPSEAENFPVVLLEAMAAGAAIITTRGTGCAEVVGDTGFLVEPGSPAEIREALLRLTSDVAECSRLGAAARKRLEARFGWRTIAEKYVEVYRKHARRAPTGTPGRQRYATAGIRE